MSEHAVGLSRLNKNAKGRQGAQITHELLAEIRCTRESQFEWRKCGCECVCVHLLVYMCAFRQQDHVLSVSVKHKGK